MKKKATHRVWRTADEGRFVADGHPDAVSLAYAPGDLMPDDIELDESTAVEREAATMQALREEADEVREQYAALAGELERERAEHAQTRAELEQAQAALADATTAKPATTAKAAARPADKAAAKPADKAAPGPADK